MADFYELLGVSRTASADDLKRAYRRKARELHPDTNPDAGATEEFKSVSRAYEVLSDPEQRARYDRFGEAGVSGAAGGGASFDDIFSGGVGDLFSSLFGGGFGGGSRRGPAGPPRGQDMEVVATISFEQAVFGATVPVTLRLPQRCADCDGSGAGSGTQAGDVCRLQRQRPGPARPPEPPRADGHDVAVLAVRRPRPGHRHAVPDLPGRGPDHRRAHVSGRRPRRSRQWLDAAPDRSRRRRTARGRCWRPVRPSARAAPRALPARR